MTDDKIPFRKVGHLADVERWPVAAYYIKDRKHRVAVARIGDDLYAFDDLCTKDDCSLASGRLKDDYLIMCQCGGCHFDIRNGAVIKGPATKPLGSYEVREQDGNIELRI